MSSSDVTQLISLPERMAEAARLIDEETAFAEGRGNAEMLVVVVRRDLEAQTTHVDWEEGTIRTSEGRAFKSLQRWLHNDISAVYRVFALLSPEGDEKYEKRAKWLRCATCRKRREAR